MRTNDFLSIDTTVAAMKTQILEDIAAGTVPSTVATYAELHDYVDANEYGSDEAWDLLVDTPEWDNVVDHLGKAQNVVDAWLKAGRP